MNIIVLQHVLVFVDILSTVLCILLSFEAKIFPQNRQHSVLKIF